MYIVLLLPSTVRYSLMYGLAFATLQMLDRFVTKWTTTDTKSFARLMKLLTKSSHRGPKQKAGFSASRERKCYFTGHVNVTSVSFPLCHPGPLLGLGNVRTRTTRTFWFKFVSSIAATIMFNLKKKHTFEWTEIGKLIEHQSNTNQGALSSYTDFYFVFLFAKTTLWNRVTFF